MSPRIVVVGSLMMDLVVRAPRLPHIGESLLSHSFRTSPGGKGANQAIAAARLGAATTMIGRIGKDRFGEILRTGLESAGVDTRFVSVDPQIGTGVAVPIVLDSGENSIFAIPQSNMALGASDIEAARETIASAGMLMLQFEVGMDATLAAARIAHEAGVPVMLNPAPIVEPPAGLLSLSSIIIANELEAASLAPAAGGDHAKELAALREYVPTAIITLGEAGAMVDDGSGLLTASGFPVTAIDTVGAGDAFCAAFAVARCEGMAVTEAARFANAAGALAVTAAGAESSLPTRSAVEAFLARQ
ncbi:MAG: ribokinase [Dehalococcoidia bacterium]